MSIKIVLYNPKNKREIKMVWNKIKETYHMAEKAFCDKHNCKMTQVPCSMYVYCDKCHQEQLKKYNKPLDDGGKI